MAANGSPTSACEIHPWKLVVSRGPSPIVLSLFTRSKRGESRESMRSVGSSTDVPPSNVDPSTIAPCPTYVLDPRNRQSTKYEEYVERNIGSPPLSTKSHAA